MLKKCKIQNNVYMYTITIGYTKVPQKLHPPPIAQF